MLILQLLLEGYNFHLICSKCASWYAYLPNTSLPDLIHCNAWNDSVPVENIWLLVLLLWIWSVLLHFCVVLVAYFEICCYHSSYIHIANGIPCICSTGLFSLCLWFFGYMMHQVCWIWLYSSPWLAHISSNVMYISKAFIHHLPLHTSMSCHTIFHLPTVKSIHYCIVVGAFGWILDMSKVWCR